MQNILQQYFILYTTFLLWMHWLLSIELKSRWDVNIQREQLTMFLLTQHSGKKQNHKLATPGASAQLMENKTEIVDASDGVYYHFPNAMF